VPKEKQVHLIAKAVADRRKEKLRVPHRCARV
jgi:hypothetical protein